MPDLFKKNDSKSGYDAIYDAQRIAFAPVVFQVARVLRDLGVLSALGESRDRGLDIDGLMEKTGVSRYGLKVLLESALSADLVKLEEDRFLLTKTGYFINYDQLTRVNMDYVNDVCYQGLFHLQEAIKNGRPEGLKVFGDWDTIYPGLTSLPAKASSSWFNFDHYYSDAAFADALRVVLKENPGSLLDIGGNTGKFALQCVARKPGLKVSILDLPEQLLEARKEIEKNDMQDRISCIEMDLLKHAGPLPTGFDALWMSQFLSCFGEQDVHLLLQRSAAAMDEQANLYILEPCWDRQHYEATAFSLMNTSLYFTCMANGVSKMYQAEELRAYVEDAGLRVVEQVDKVGICHTLFRCKKKTE